MQIDVLKIIRAISLFALLTRGSAQNSVPTGPAVGSSVPAFEAAGQNGQLHNLQSLLGPKGLILVFYRSADW